jgi:hypothetical protein
MTAMREPPKRPPAEDEPNAPPDDPERGEDARPFESDDEKVDREADHTFPASDPPANY